MGVETASKGLNDFPGSYPDKDIGTVVQETFLVISGITTNFAHESNFKHNQTIYMNPYISGLLTAVVYLFTYRFLPKKITGIVRGVVSIAITIVILLVLQLIIDGITRTITAP